LKYKSKRGKDLRITESPWKLRDRVPARAKAELPNLKYKLEEEKGTTTTKFTSKTHLFSF
jgi:hypothetical protein